jgi:uncharacterized protein (TIGR03083 family)
MVVSDVPYASPDQTTEVHMTASADRMINALRSGHDALAAKVVTMTPEALRGPSGASEWTVAQVLSHLGSGAEINSGTLARSLRGADEPTSAGAQEIWDRWNAMSPTEQAENFLVANASLVEEYEGLDDETRADAKIDLGYLPAPVDVATAAGFRLNEFTFHSWDVEAGSNPSAVLAQEAVEQLIDLVPGMIGWLAKPDVLDERPVTIAVEIADLGRSFGLELGDTAAVTDVPTDARATLSLRAESWLRLLLGRLGAEHTPADVVVTGAITLDELREVFPGI